MPLGPRRDSRDDAIARSPTGSPSSRARRRPGCGSRRSRRGSAASPSSSPTIPTATAASPTASASTRRKAPRGWPRAMRAAGYEMPGFPETGAALMERLLGGPTNRPRRRDGRPGRRRRAGPRTTVLRLADVCALPRLALPTDRTGRAAGRALGRARSRPVLRRRRVPPRRPPLRQRRRRRAAGARLRHRPEGDLPRSRPRAAAPLPRLLCLAARSPSPPTRSSTSASTAISNGCPARRLACRRRCWPEVGARRRCRSSIRSSSTIPGEGSQAKRRASRGDRRSSDAGDDARRNPRRPRRARDADRRILRRRRHRSAPPRPSREARSSPPPSATGSTATSASAAATAAARSARSTRISAN